MMDEYRRGYDLPLTMRKWEFWLILVVLPLFIFKIEDRLQDMDGVFPWIMRLFFYLLMFLIVASEFIQYFGKLHLVPEGIAVTLFGKTIRQFPRENIRFLGGIVYRKKSTAYKWICVCAMTMEELAVEMERQTPKMLRNSRTRPGWAEDMAKKYLLRCAGDFRGQLGLPNRDVLLLEWSPERLEMLMEMYPGVPWCDLMEKKILEGERKEPVKRRYSSRHIW